MDSFLEWVSSVDSDGKIGVLGPTTTFSSKQKKRVYQCQLKISAAVEASFFDQLSRFLTEKSSHLWFDADSQT
jgi:hypothetical protein